MIGPVARLRDAPRELVRSVLERAERATRRHVRRQRRLLAQRAYREELELSIRTLFAGDAADALIRAARRRAAREPISVTEALEDVQALAYQCADRGRDPAALLSPTSTTTVGPAWMAGRRSLSISELRSLQEDLEGVLSNMRRVLTSTAVTASAVASAFAKLAQVMDTSLHGPKEIDGYRPLELEEGPSDA